MCEAYDRVKVIEMGDSQEAGEGRKEDTVLVVGLVCMDIILSCSHYPVEDSSNRALDFVKRRGGNGSNSCTVLSQLRINCEILATFGGDEDAKFLKDDLQLHGISFKHSPTFPQCKTPFTNIVLSQASGSRTGIHFRGNFPENSFEDFSKIDLSNYSWIHFEGRCFVETQKMMAFIDLWNEKQGKKMLYYSVELEKCNEETKKFIPLADYIFVSKDFARYMGYENMLSSICGISPLVKEGYDLIFAFEKYLHISILPSEWSASSSHLTAHYTFVKLPNTCYRAVIIVPWGDQGAMARCSNGDIAASKAYPPHRILDSVGAGDTFIAATISYLAKEKSVEESIEFGCRVAGAKVGMTGFSRLRSELLNLENPTTV